MTKKKATSRSSAIDKLYWHDGIFDGFEVLAKPNRPSGTLKLLVQLYPLALTVPFPTQDSPPRVPFELHFSGVESLKSDLDFGDLHLNRMFGNIDRVRKTTYRNRMKFALSFCGGTIEIVCKSVRVSSVVMKSAGRLDQTAHLLRGRANARRPLRKERID